MVGVMFVKDLAILIISSVALIYSGLLVVRSLIKISYKMHVREYILSFVLLAMSTSIPELFVGITSALNKTPVLSLGNIIGANIMDVTFVIGVAAIVARRFPINTGLVRSTSIYAVGIAAVPIILALIGDGLSRIDGVILIIIFFVYMNRVLKQRKGLKSYLSIKEEKEVLEEVKNSKEDSKLRRVYLRIKDEISFNFVLFVIGMALVFLSANFVTRSATGLAQDLGLSQLLIGMIIVSIGTTLPELVLEARIVIARRRDMAFGDPLGSVVVNSTFILGLVAFISPFSISSYSFYTGAMFLIAATSLLAIMLNTRKMLTWKDGVLMIIFYLIFIITQFSIKAI